MNSLKKALAKDDLKKYQKNKIEISGFKKSTQYRDIESILPKVNAEPFREKMKKQQPKILKINSKLLSKIILAMDA